MKKIILFCFCSFSAQNLLSSAETIEKPSNGTSWWTDVSTPFPHSLLGAVEAY